MLAWTNVYASLDLADNVLRSVSPYPEVLYTYITIGCTLPEDSRWNEACYTNILNKMHTYCT